MANISTITFNTAIDNEARPERRMIYGKRTSPLGRFSAP
jgi:hypothetical protein